MLTKVLIRILSLELILLVSLGFLLDVSPSYALDLTLHWDANTEPDLAGYKFYYALESRHPYDSTPYEPICADYAGVEYSTDGGNTWHAIVCPPPIVVDSSVTEIMLRYLDGNTAHFFAVAAYDTEGDGLVSDFSNEEATLCISWPEEGLYVHEDNHDPYTIRGRANAGAEVELFSGATLGTATTNGSRDWEIPVNFELNFTEGAVSLEVRSEGITAPLQVAIYDMTKPTSEADDRDAFNGHLIVYWSASDENGGIDISGLASVELWAKKEDPEGNILWDWTDTGFSRNCKGLEYTAGSAYYTLSEPESAQDGTYYFATRSVDRARNWEQLPSGDGDTSIYYTAPPGSPGSFPDGHTGIEASGGGCFIATAASP